MLGHLQYHDDSKACSADADLTGFGCRATLRYQELNLREVFWRENLIIVNC